MRRVVVLPQPEGPRREKNSPSATVRSMSSTATTSPKRLVTPWSSTAMVVSLMMERSPPLLIPRLPTGFRHRRDSVVEAQDFNEIRLVAHRGQPILWSPDTPLTGIPPTHPDPVLSRPWWLTQAHFNKCCRHWQPSRTVARGE